MRFFGFKWFGQTNPSRLLINVLKYFQFWFQIRQDIQLFGHSAYPPCTYRSVPHILSIRTDSFCIFSVYDTFIPFILSIWTGKLHLKIYLILRSLRICTDSFRVFSVYKQIHSVILSIHADSFHVFGEWALINSNIRNWIIFITDFKGILL